MTNFCQNLPLTHAMAKNSFHHQWIASKTSTKHRLTNYLRVHYCQMLMGLLLLRFVSEACQMSMSARVSIECHWLACTGSHLAGKQHTTGRWYRPWIELYFVMVWVIWGLLVGHLTLKISELRCNLPLCGSHHPYISACGVDKNYIKWLEIQLAIHCGEGSIIVLE